MLLHLMVELGRDLGVPWRWSGKHILVLALVLGSNSLIIVHYPESDQIERNIQRLRGEETTRPAPAPGTVLYAAESLIENHHENCWLVCV